MSRVHHPVTALGYGRRVGVWFQGCSLHCHGCISRDTWKPAPPEDMVDVDDLLDRIRGYGDVDGLTISGGEPFDQPAALKHLLHGYRQITDPTTTDILVYSGYTTGHLRRRHPDIAALPDVLVTGPFRMDLPGDRLRGSTNQELVIQSTLAQLRYGTPSTETSPTMQVVVAGESLWMIGIPAAGDMERLRERLAARGIVVGDVSWQA